MTFEEFGLMLFRNPWLGFGFAAAFGGLALGVAALFNRGEADRG